MYESTVLWVIIKRWHHQFRKKYKIQIFRNYFLKSHGSFSKPIYKFRNVYQLHISRSKTALRCNSKIFNSIKHSGFYYVRPVFTNHNVRTLGTQSIAALYMTPRTGSIYFPNRLFFVTRIGCVYYEVQTQFLNNV